MSTVISGIRLINLDTVEALDDSDKFMVDNSDSGTRAATVQVVANAVKTLESLVTENEVQTMIDEAVGDINSILATLTEVSE